MIQIKTVFDWWDIIYFKRLNWIDFRFFDISLTYEHADRDLDIFFIVLGLGLWINIQW